MARPITKIQKSEPTAEEKRNRALEDILDEVAANKEAMSEAVRFFSRMHESGWLSFFNAVLARQEELLRIAVKEANKPENTAILQNLLGLMQMIGKIHVDGLDEVTKRMNNGLQEAASARHGERVSAFQMLKALKDPEINRAIVFLLAFLKGVGKINETEQK